MRLKNKKTGEIIEVENITSITATLKADKNTVQLTGVDTNGYRKMYRYESLAELNEEWEDYEDPKEYWFIDADFGICGDEHTGDPPKYKYEIGNYFETKEEAERAVEKLKALKRLKDAGFSFTGFEETDRGCLGDFTIYCYIKPDYTRPYDEVDEDLDLLFGGEE